MTRRRFAALLPVALAGTIALTGGLGAIGASGAGAAPAPAIAAQVSGLQTTVDLNLRAGPGTNYPVLLVIPRAANVFDHGEGSNGFRHVTYNNTAGWAAEQYLTPGEYIPPHAGPVVGTAFTAVDLNLRSGPGSGNAVIRVMPRGSAVEITETVANGYRYVYFQGLGGWAADQYLSSGPGDGPYDPSKATATADLNLRASPSRSAPVLLVIPEGGQVDVLPGASGEYREVAYQGTRGWAAYAYLN